MKKTKVLFAIWAVVVVVIVVLLTVLGFMLKKQSSEYIKLEEKLLDSAKKYVDNKFLYPNDKNKIKVTSKELIENKYLDNLKIKDDVCTGYVVVWLDGVYKYKSYIKCDKYTSKNYVKQEKRLG